MPSFGESVKKGKILNKNIFSVIVEWSLKKLQEMISAGVKTYVKQQDKNELFVRSTFKTWNTM